MAFTFARRRDLSQSLRSGPIAFSMGAFLMGTLSMGMLLMGMLSMGVIGIFALATVAQCAPIGPSPAPEIPAKDAAKAPAEKKPAPARASIDHPKADAKAEIEAAVKTAKIERMRVLVVYGGKGCLSCDKLHDLFKENKEIATILRGEFVQVLVDVDTQPKVFDQYVKKSEQLNQSEQWGVPFLTVLDSNGKVLVNQGTGVFETGALKANALKTGASEAGAIKTAALKTGALEAGPKYDSQKVKAFLEKWSLPTLDAEKVFADALSRAKSESKRILLRAGMPRIVWCRLLDQFFDENASLFASDFVSLQIDQERMTNGRQLLKRLRPEESRGFPWMAILDADGKPLVTSDEPSRGNIGLPVNPAEIGFFMDMLQQTIQRTTPEQLALIEKKLNEARKRVPFGGRTRILPSPRRI
jgi:thioredoxin-related protein